MPEEDAIEAKKQNDDTRDDFSNEFGLSNFDRLKARIDPTTGEFEEVEQKAPSKTEDIGRIWQDLKKINYAEEVRTRSQALYVRSLPLWRRVTTTLKSAFMRDEDQGPPVAPVNITSKTIDSSLANGTTTAALPGQVAKHTTIEVKFSMPENLRLHKKLPPLPKSREEVRAYLEQLRGYLEQLFLRIPRRFWIVSGSAIAGVTVVWLGIHIVNASVIKDPSASNASDASVNKNNKLPKGTPAFNTLLPIGKSAEDVGGWTRISPPDREAVWAYADKIGDIKISVSQQPIPKAFKLDTEDRVADLASNYHATEKIKAADTTIYVGRTKEGVESVILTKEKLLILIKTSGIVGNDQWVSYINSLQLQ